MRNCRPAANNQPLPSCFVGSVSFEGLPFAQLKALVLLLDVGFSLGFRIFGFFMNLLILKRDLAGPVLFANTGHLRFFDRRLVVEGLEHYGVLGDSRRNTQSPCHFRDMSMVVTAVGVPTLVRGAAGHSFLWPGSYLCSILLQFLLKRDGLL